MLVFIIFFFILPGNLPTQGKCSFPLSHLGIQDYFLYANSADPPEECLVMLPDNELPIITGNSHTWSQWGSTSHQLLT